MRTYRGWTEAPGGAMSPRLSALLFADVPAGQPVVQVLEDVVEVRLGRVDIGAEHLGARVVLGEAALIEPLGARVDHLGVTADPVGARRLIGRGLPRVGGREQSVTHDEVLERRARR